MNASGEEKGRVSQRIVHRGDVISVVFCLGVCFTAFGAVYKPEFLNYLAASPGVLLILLATCVALCGGKLIGEARLSLLLLLYGVGCGFFAIFYVGMSDAYLVKGVSLAVLNLVWLGPLFCVRFIRRAHLLFGLVAAISISLSGFLLLDVFRASFPALLYNFIFGGIYADYDILRARAFMQENSHFAVLVGRYAFCVYMLSETRSNFSPLRLVSFLVVLATLLLLVGSKGASVSVLVALCVIGVSRKQLPFFALLAPVLYFAAMAQVDAVSYDIENYTSASTRMTLLLMALIALLFNPLGYGFYGFYGVFRELGLGVVGWLSLHSPVPLIFAEVEGIVVDLVNVSTKSTLFDFLITFGVVFVIFLWQLLRRVDMGDPRVRAMLAFLFASSLSTSGHESISLFLGLAVLCKYYKLGGESGSGARRVASAR